MLFSCKSCQKTAVCSFRTMKIYKSQIDQLNVCDSCDSLDSSNCFKRLIFQFTDSTTRNNIMQFYLTGWIGYDRKDHVDPQSLNLNSIQDDTIIVTPFSFANVDWTKGEIRKFLKDVASDNKCKDANYSYITLKVYVDDSQGKRYLSLYATAYDTNGNKIYSAALSEKSANPRPPYPPQG